MWDLFKVRARNSALETEVAMLRAQNEKLEWKVEKLEAEVRSERSKKDKFVNQYCNQISQKNGLYGVFEDAPKPRKVEQEPRELTQAETDKINYLAEQTRLLDLENDIDKPLHVYIEQMMKPDKLEYYLNLA